MDFFVNWMRTQKGEGIEYHLLVLAMAAALRSHATVTGLLDAGFSQEYSSLVWPLRSQPSTAKTCSLVFPHDLQRIAPSRAPGQFPILSGGMICLRKVTRRYMFS
jgi:hypothetical protein